MSASSVLLAFRRSEAGGGLCDVADTQVVQGSRRDWDFKLPEIVNTCFPRGARLLRAKCAGETPIPRFHSFVLTGGAGQRVFGASLVFFEEMPRAEEEALEAVEAEALLRAEAGLGCAGEAFDSIVPAGTTTPSADTVAPRSVDAGSHAIDGPLTLRPRCLALLSHSPQFSSLRKMLSQLFALSSSPVPVERIISRMVLHVPRPIPGRRSVLLWPSFERQAAAAKAKDSGAPQHSIGQADVIFTAPRADELPSLDLPFRSLSASG